MTGAARRGWSGWTVLLVLIAGACGPHEGGPAPAAPNGDPTPPPSAAATTTPTAVPTPTPSATGTPAAAPPRAAPWRPGDREVLPEAKQLATRIVEALTTYDAGEADDVLERVVPDAALREATAAVAAPLLHHDRWSRGRVLYPQLGGYRQDAASVMVVVEQRSARPAGDTATTTRTVDIRLRRVDGRWRFAALPSIGGDPVARPDDLPPEAITVLDDPRIHLPDSSRWDIHAGLVDRDLLRVMAGIAERTSYVVVTITSGHPHHVFGTDRLSDHTDGRAVDIALLGDAPVVEDRAEGSAAHALVRWLWQHPDVRQIGSPWALDGYGGRSFTDLVHQDHLHVAVAPDEPPDDPGDGPG
ncbi:MAG: hypothetical protein KY461_12900 [Actinobacteria bacterium]|nr:hypothetical protein [Actinomycetota bacterium]